MLEHDKVFNRHWMGVETILWSNDYPHHRGDWPESRRIIDEHMKEVPADERRKILADNAVRIYKLNGNGRKG